MKYRIGVLMSSYYDSYQCTILSSIIKQAREYGHSVFCFSGGGINDIKHNTASRNSLLDIISVDTLDILVILTGSIGAFASKNDLIDFTKRFNPIPIVSIGLKLKGAYSIIIDNKSGMKELLNHFIKDHGYKHIAFIKGPKNNEEAIQRFEAYKESLLENGLEFNDQLVCPGDFLDTSGIEGVQILLDQRKVEIDAIVGADDNTILSTISPLNKRGYSIPGDIAIGGFDDVEESQYSTPPLTTVFQPLAGIGEEAVNTAIRVLENRQTVTTITLATKLIIRKSCGCSISNIFQKYKKKSLIVFKKSTNIHESILKEVVSELGIIKLEERDYDDLIRDIKKLISCAIKTVSINNPTAFMNLLDSCLRGSHKDSSYFVLWNSIISIILGILKSHYNSKGKLEFLNAIWNSSIEIISEFNMQSIIQKRFVWEKRSSELQTLTNKLMNTFNMVDIKKIIIDLLPTFKINNAFFCLYSKDELNSDNIVSKSRLIFYLQNDSSLSGISAKNEFKSDLLIPGGFPHHNSYYYLTLPILFDEENLGYILFELSHDDWLTYELLSSQISSALKGYELLMKIEDHTKELKSLVKERTLELENANLLLRELSYVDQGSGLKNRRFLTDVIIPEANTILTNVNFENHNKNQRSLSGNKYLGIYMIDIDHFKIVNDEYGHDSGDLVIKQISTIFKNFVRENDCVIRWGGEEFLLILREFNPEYMMIKAEQIRKTIQEFSFELTENRRISKTCSIGCLTYPIFPFKELDFLSAIQLVDKALYHSKDSGRNKAFALVAKTNQKTKIKDKNSDYYISDMFEKGFNLIDCSISNKSK